MLLFFRKNILLKKLNKGERGNILLNLFKYKLVLFVSNYYTLSIIYMLKIKISSIFPVLRFEYTFQHLIFTHTQIVYIHNLFQNCNYNTLR